jgi:hypothetical protein
MQFLAGKRPSARPCLHKKTAPIAWIGAAWMRFDMAKS